MTRFSINTFNSLPLGFFFYLLSGERVPILSYPEPHRVQKNRPSVLEDNFENPYVREKRDTRRRRIRRQVRPSKSKKTTAGIPKMTSTGEDFPSSHTRRVDEIKKPTRQPFDTLFIRQKDSYPCCR